MNFYIIFEPYVFWVILFYAENWGNNPYKVLGTHFSEEPKLGK